MRIALDAMGTDGAPSSEIAGALQALASLEPDVEVLLVGDESLLRNSLTAFPHAPEVAARLRIVHAPDRVFPGEPAVAAVRRKPDSSIAVGLRLQKQGEADAFVSAGSTGAVMAGSVFALRPLPGVDRPAIGTVLPTAASPTLLLDAGANVDCRPQHLVQFARLGAIYAQDLMGVARPRIGLLNIGEEPEKGDERSIEAHRLLSSSGLDFVGNIEGRDIVRGGCDVLVCDGFVGNVLLKFYESVASFVAHLLREEVERQGVTLDFASVFRSLDYTEYGGAPLLGVNGVTIIAHGSSNPKAIRNAVAAAVRAVRSSMVPHMARELSRHIEPAAPGEPA